MADTAAHLVDRVLPRAPVRQWVLSPEIVWWDAAADAAVNDLDTVAFTSDASRMYWGFRFYNDPDPISLAMIELAIDAGPGGTGSWWDPTGSVQTPGHCSVDGSRLCTTDEDCHFCTNSTAYTGTPHERPQVCGSTDAFDSCDPLDPTDLCIRTQTCEGLVGGAPVTAAGADAAPALAPDYLLVFDLGRWLVGICDSVMLLRADNGSWSEIPRPTPDTTCFPPLETWRFPLLVDPGTGGSGPPGELELAVPWEAFDCPGCVPLGPGDDFRWTVQVSRATITVDYAPDGPIEDVISEAVPGTWTTTTDACATPGEPATLCEIEDGSTDAFVSTAPQGSGGTTGGLILRCNDTASPDPSITLMWDPSCARGDHDYVIFEGTIGDWYSHGAPSSGAICSTGGATEATFDAGAGDHYYLVVPRDLMDEGSCGARSGGPERPTSNEACLSQALGGCP